MRCLSLLLALAGCEGLDLASSDDNLLHSRRLVDQAITLRNPGPSPTTWTVTTQAGSWAFTVAPGEVGRVLVECWEGDAVCVQTPGRDAVCTACGSAPLASP